MKKCWLVMCLMVTLTGCGAVETFETMQDEYLQPVMGQMRQINLTVPISAAAPVMNDENGGRLYLCDGYVLTLQTLEGGDLDRTARAVSGFGCEKLSVVETAISGGKRFDWVWTAVGEGGDHIGRVAVLDDGTYHYCVSVMADADTAGALEAEWSGLFSSVTLN